MFDDEVPALFPNLLLGLAVLLVIWVISAVLHLAWWLSHNPFYLLFALFVWMLWSNPKTTSSTTSVPHQSSSTLKKKAKKKPAKKKVKKKPAKKKVKKKEDPGPPSPLVAKGKLPSASSVLKRNSESP